MFDVPMTMFDERGEAVYGVLATDRPHQVKANAHQWRPGGRTRLMVSVNAINVLNQATAINYFPSELFQGQAIAIDESTFYGGVDTQALIVDQRLVRDPRFMMNSEFQSPRTIRLGLKFGF